MVAPQAPPAGPGLGFYMETCRAARCCGIPASAADLTSGSDAVERRRPTGAAVDWIRSTMPMGTRRSQIVKASLMIAAFLGVYLLFTSQLINDAARWIADEFGPHDVPVEESGPVGVVDGFPHGWPVDCEEAERCPMWIALATKALDEQAPGHYAVVRSQVFDEYAPRPRSTVVRAIVVLDLADGSREAVAVTCGYGDCSVITDAADLDDCTSPLCDP
jgi:hypothetical protein